MNRTSIAVASVVVPMLVLLACSPIEESSEDPTFETRHYRGAEILINGGSDPEEQALYEAYGEAVSGTASEERLDTSAAIRSAFERCGIEFPDGSSVFVKPTDGFLIIRHRPSILETIERRFGFEEVPSGATDESTADDPFTESSENTNNDSNKRLDSNA